VKARGFGADSAVISKQMEANRKQAKLGTGFASGLLLVAQQKPGRPTLDPGRARDRNEATIRQGPKSSQVDEDGYKRDSEERGRGGCCSSKGAKRGQILCW
jgi:hypothetical protein